MNKETILKKYELWKKMTKDTEIKNELDEVEDSFEKIEDRFYKELSFGTGGLRGEIGAGTNRINIHTIAKASQGLANYINSIYKGKEKSIAISYDSRIKSDLFARISAEVFAGNNIRVYLYSELMPTPCLSFAVRNLNCDAGIMITASHNPSKYNGYKVYNEDGCQITTEAASFIQKEIEKTDPFENVTTLNYEKAIKSNWIKIINEKVYTDYIENVKKQTLIKETEEIDKNLSIIFTPLNGAGLKPILRVLNESGYTNITVVKEQEAPDGTFPTCPYPNPEEKETMELGIKYAKKNKAELVLATDPDCDRVGIAVKNNAEEYQLISGNEVGILLLDYICLKRIENKTMPRIPVCIKTIVTTEMAKKIAQNYNVEIIEVLTGFKFIGEKIGILENEGKKDSYILGFEESYGYLSGTYVRDKDAVNGAFLICEMSAYYKSKGMTLIDKLNELYKKYGYYLNTLHSYEFKGIMGFKRMEKIMVTARSSKWSEIGENSIFNTIDYNTGINNLPKSDVIKFFLEDATIVIRPSGTEPKMKIYISVKSDDKNLANIKEHKLIKDLEMKLKIDER